MKTLVTVAEIARTLAIDVRAARKRFALIVPAAILISGRKLLPLYESSA
jgi:hypothetical protein